MATKQHRVQAMATQQAPTAKPRIHLSTHLVRFQLPMDLCKLEDLSAVQYLRAYCRCDEPLVTLFRSAFNQRDRNKDGLLSMKEAEQALLSIFILDPGHLDRLRQLLMIDGTFRVDPPLFVALSALTSRVLLKEPMNDAVKPESISGKEGLESADFFALQWKLSDIPVQDDLRALLAYLS